MGEVVAVRWWIELKREAANFRAASSSSLAFRPPLLFLIRSPQKTPMISKIAPVALSRGPALPRSSPRPSVEADHRQSHRCPLSTALDVLLTDLPGSMCRAGWASVCNPCFWLRVASATFGKGFKRARRVRMRGVAAWGAGRDFRCVS